MKWQKVPFELHIAQVDVLKYLFKDIYTETRDLYFCLIKKNNINNINNIKMLVTEFSLDRLID